MDGGIWVKCKYVANIFSPDFTKGNKTVGFKECQRTNANSSVHKTK